MRLIEDVGSAGRQGRNAPNIVVADCQPLVGAALAALMASHGWAVTATVDDTAGVHAAIAGCDLLLIDIALFDLALPARLPVVITTPTASHPGLAAAINAGIAGLIVKTQSAALLPQCLARVAAGGTWFDSTALAEIAVQAEAHKDARALTRRECDVARLVASGQRNRLIATSLGISEGTVKMHLHNVYTKLGLESRTQLAMDERVRSGSGSFGAAGAEGRQRREELVA